MRRWTFLLLGLLLLAASLSAHAEQQTVNVVVLNPAAPRYVTLAPGVDVVVVRQGWVVTKLNTFKTIRDLVKNTPIFFALAAYDETGAPIDVSQEKFDYVSEIGPLGETIWRVSWEYEIKAKKLPSGTYMLVGTWTSSVGAVITFLPTYMTIP